MRKERKEAREKEEMRFHGSSHPHFSSIFHFSLLRNPNGYLVSHHS